ncbi:MAG: hypothetical protein EBZ59_04310 [Planctomycetia bacterium]|nr:hypothetical protein [Planctomycetia bacterium]
MTPDDPRLGEWVDGRLSPAEAAEVERIVGASTELTRTVADLRAIKAALADMPTRPPEAGFVGRVLRRIDAVEGQAAASGDDDDVEVADEWQRIEQERIAGERAEAMEDVGGENVAGVAPAGDRGRGLWPLAAMAAALAAGVLFAFAINRPARMDVGQATVPVGGTPGPDRGPSFAAARGPSSVAAAGRATGLLVRVYLRDDRGRGRLEEVLAASDLRIESGETDTAATPAAAEDSRRAVGPSEWLTVEGPPAAVDALLAALAEPTVSLSLEPTEATAPSPADQEARQEPAETAASPSAVRLRIEIIDQPAVDGATSAGGGG